MKKMPAAAAALKDMDQKREEATMKRFVWMAVLLLLLWPLAGEAADYNPGAKATVILQTDKMSNGDPIDYVDLDSPQVTVMIVEIAPGAETGWHSHPIAVYAYVLAGGIRVSVEGGKTVDFKQGEAFVEVMKLRHNGVNLGNVPVKMVVFYLGAKNLPNVVKGNP